MLSEESTCKDVRSGALIRQTESSAELYLELLKRCLTRSLFHETYESIDEAPGSVVRNFRRRLFALVNKWLAASEYEIVKHPQFDLKLREEGRDWPSSGETMIGLKRLDNIHYCMREVLLHNVPGDVIETGVWRGGAAILMRAVLKALGDKSRTVWVADSFQGLPQPDARKYPVDAGDPHWKNKRLAVSVEEVKANFLRYGLLDDRVQFLKGWFKDTLPNAPIDRLAVMRLDGDMYESTIDALLALYHRLSVGGYVIIDDYALKGCRAAVDDFRAKHHIAEELHQVDWTGVYWKRCH